MKKRGRLKAGGSSPAKAITGGEHPWRSPWLIATPLVIVAAMLLAFTSLDSGDPQQGGPGDSEGPGTGRVYHDVGILTSDLETEARWYTYESGEAQVRFFTVLEDNGKIHVALDACDICYSRNLGFHQDGDDMECNSCGKAFEVKGIGSENLPNTCWPSYVPYDIAEGYVLIDTEFLDTKAYMFE
jgi:uncharacterized membrane protein